MWGESRTEHLSGIQPERKRGGSNVRSGGDPAGKARVPQERGLEGWLGGQAGSRQAHFKSQGM